MKLTSKQKELLNSIENKNLRKEIKKEFKKVGATRYFSKWKLLEELIALRQIVKAQQIIQRVKPEGEIIDKDSLKGIQKLIVKEKEEKFDMWKLYLDTILNNTTSLEMCQDLKNACVILKDYKTASKFREKEKSIEKIKLTLPNKEFNIEDVIFEECCHNRFKFKLCENMQPDTNINGLFKINDKYYLKVFLNH